MKIRRLEVKGFRSLAHVVWEPGDLNVLIGPNASGKSNVLRVFELLSMYAVGRLSEYVQGEGGMEPLVWDRSAYSIEINLTTIDPDTIPILSPDGFRYRLTLERMWGPTAYRVGDKVLMASDEGEGNDAQPSELVHRNRTSTSALLFSEQGAATELAPDQLSEEETVLSLLSGTLWTVPSAFFSR